MKPFLIKWRDAFTSEAGPDKTARLVLFVLSTYMDQNGKDKFGDAGCWPTQKTIAERAGLSTKAVKEALKRARTGGWIRTEEAGESASEDVEKHFEGQGWRRSRHIPLIPKGGEGDSPRSEKVGNLTPEGGEPDAGNVGKEIPPISVDNSVGTSLSSEEEEEEEKEDAIEGMWQTWLEVFELDTTLGDTDWPPLEAFRQENPILQEHHEWFRDVVVKIKREGPTNGDGPPLPRYWLATRHKRDEWAEVLELKKTAAIKEAARERAKKNPRIRRTIDRTGREVVLKDGQPIETHTNGA